MGRQRSTGQASIVTLPLPQRAYCQAAQKRLRHLGNDYVCVVWSEHWRPYHRSTIATGAIIVLSLI